MKTVEEILRESGLTDEQIKAIDAKAVTALTQVVSTASQDLEKAELAKRAQQQQYDTEIAPALDKWANDSANLAAERDYYKTLALKAKDGGFVPAAEPFTPIPGSPVKDPATGKFVPSGTVVQPTNPNYMTKQEGFSAVTAATWVLSEYMRLNNGSVPPDDIQTLANEAAGQRMQLRDYVEKKYDFGKKRDEIKAAAQKSHDDAIRKEAKEAADKEWAEKIGSNPDIRQAQTSGFAEVKKAVVEGKRPDPLKMTREERRLNTRNQIAKDFAEHAAETVN
jgi:hypothetical protein